MTPPTVQFIPAAPAAGLVWDISGTLGTSFGLGARDSSPTITLPSGGFTGLSYIGIREDGGLGLAFVFNNSTNRNAFVSAYPNDFAQVTWYDSVNQTNVITSSGWIWDISSNVSRAYLRTSQWANWATVGVGHVGASYTLQA